MSTWERSTTMKVRFGFTIGPEVDASSFAEIIDHLERLRFDSIWIPESILQPTLDPLVALSYAASRTERLGIGTHLILPGRHPVQLAQQLAQLDQLSDGRLLLLGVLGLPDEADAGVQGIDRRRRGAAMEEMVPLLHRLWAGETVDHDGEFSSFTGASVTRPTQDPLELWLAGQAPSALERCGRLGDGWMPGFVTPQAATDMRAVVEAAAADNGRAMDPEHYGINLFYASDALPPEVAERLNARRGSGNDVAAAVPIGWDALRDRIDEWLDVGFSKFLLRPLMPPENWETELETLAEEILPLTT